MSDIQDIKSSNQTINRLIENGKPFSIIRLGGAEAYVAHDWIIYKNVTRYLHPVYKTLYNAGIYGDISKMELYARYYDEAIKNSDVLASFPTHEGVVYTQKYFSKRYSLPQIHNRALEPFHIINEGLKPWSHNLLGKKVLVISPFVKSFQKQIEANFQIFKNEKIFLDKQEFVYYKCFQTIAGNHIHKDWFETFSIMCDDISKLDFDIALLGCGGYGLPLCNFIKEKLGKSAIYIGGGLQLLFGVMGGRWENFDLWKKIIEENGTEFIKPSEDELCDNLKKIENGCYW